MAESGEVAAEYTSNTGPIMLMAAAAEVSAVNTSLASPAAPSPAAAAEPPTPLEQRQWQRLAQRSMRLAVTAFKDAETRVLEATTQGTALATQLTNSMLSERYLPSMELPEVLKAVDGLQQAAIKKLKRQQQLLLQRLEEQLLVITDAVQDMQCAIADISSNLQPSSSWQHSMAVFHTLTLPESRDLLLQILDMYKHEVASKQGLLESYRQFVEGNSSGSNSRGTNGRLDSSSQGSDVLRKVLTAAVTTWMVRPYVDLETCQQLLQLLTDEMVGF